ncbi:MAG TPA: cation:proton antiporter, partial [Thermoanaerobaculia bacterium]|nr:cation:proton antiporter [Thermoanaerobaculia bacterium]
TGILIGPSGFRLFEEAEAVEGFAEIGVVFLLFAVGLEFSLERLREIRRAFFLGGSVQAGATILLSALVALALGFSGLQALFFGFVIALSSTAIVLKLYNERRELESPQGKVVLGILLFQDFLIVPMIVLTPVLAGAVRASAGAFATRFGLGVLAVAVVFVVARYLMPRLLYYLVRTRIREVFVLGALLVCLGMAYFTESLGFSLALGGFLAGIIISESEYSHQVVADMIPFRDLFTSVFFISIGMLFDAAFAVDRMALVLGLTLLVFLLKTVTGAMAAAALLFPPRIIAMVALGLAQIGEFSFVLLNVGRGHGLVEPATYQALIAVTVLSMLATPALVALAPAVGQRLPRWLSRRVAGAAALPEEDGEPSRNHVVIVGFGLNGRTLANVLAEAGIRYVVIELNGDTVQKGLEQGQPMIFGDSTRREILEHAGIEAAQVVVFAISDVEAVRRSIALARQLNPAVYIVVRTRQLSQIEELSRCGADEVIAEEFEAAIEIFTRVLQRFHVPRNIIRTQTRVLRGERYRMLRASALRGEVSAELLRALEAGTTDLFRLEEASPAVGETLREVDLRRHTGATVIAVVRGETSLPNPPGDLALQAGDTLVLVGSHEQVDRAMALLEAAPAAVAEDEAAGAGDAPAASG